MQDACQKLESSTCHPRIQNTYLKVIFEAGANLEKCVVLSTPRFPNRNALGKPEAMNVSNSGGTEDQPQKHMDHISEKGYAMKVLDAKAAVDEAWEKLPAGKSKPSRKWFNRRRRTGDPVHFASSWTSAISNTPNSPTIYRNIRGSRDVLQGGTTSKATVGTKQ